MAILTIGLVNLLAVFGIAMAATQNAQQDMIAKQLANQAMESIFTARDTSQITWLMIQNVGSGTVPDGIFVTGSQPINQAGPDGIYGTADDAGAGPQTLQLPGPDGIVGTADDPPPLGLTDFSRSILIQPVVSGGVTLSNLRQITITIQYVTPQFHTQKQYVLNGFISAYR